MFIMLKRGLDFIAGKVHPMKNYDEVLQIDLEVPGNPTKIRMGYDGSKVLIAVLQKDKTDVIHVIPSAEEE